MNSQHDDANDWNSDFILQKLRETNCSQLSEKFFDSNTLLHVAARLGYDQIVEAIISTQQCQEHSMPKNSSGDPPLHVAANAGHLPIVQHLVSSSPQCHELLMAQNSSGDLPLHVAVNAGHLPIVQHLVEFSNQCQELLTTNQSSDNIPLPHPPVDANARYQSSVNLPHQQLQDHYTSKLLQVKNKEGNTPLELAWKKENEAVNYSSLQRRYREVAEFLFDKDPANELKELPRFPSPRRIPALGYDGGRVGGLMLDQAEMQKKRYTSPRRLRMKVPHESKDKVTSIDGELYKAVKCRDINFILTKAKDLEHSALFDKTPELNTILHLAAASSDDDDQFVQKTLEIQLCQKFVTEKNSKGDLPLHVAASAGNIQIVKLLVEWSDKHLQDHCNCVPLMEKNMEENTPLHLALIKKFQVSRNWALKAKYNKVARILVEKCPKVSFYPNKESKYPLYLAAEGGDEELVKHMIANRLATNGLPDGKSAVHAAFYYLMTITNLPYCKTILHTAIYGSFTARNKGILDTVLESLPNDILTVKDHEGMTPLFYAASIGYLEGVESLLRKTTKCCVYNERDAGGFYLIHIASWKGHVKVVKKFLQEYPDMIELLTVEGQNILHVAAMNGKAKVVTYMLKRHDLKVEMLINNEDQNGDTPLHLAAKNKHPMVVSILTWDKRVDLKALNKEGKRALDIALNDSEKNPSFREQLTWQVLRYVSSPRAPPRRKRTLDIAWKDSETNSSFREGDPPRRINSKEPLTTDEYKDRTDTLLLVATLVATVTFAAAFTMPGGYKDSGGMAKFLEKPMFHVFVISNSIAMYSAITAVVALIWARLDDLNLFIAAYKFSVPVVGLAITMVSIAFMAGNYLVLRDLNWLAYLILSIGSFFLFTLSILFFPLILPTSSPHPIIRYILRYPFYLLIIFTRCDTDDGEEEFTQFTECDTRDAPTSGCFTPNPTSFEYHPDDEEEE